MMININKLILLLGLILLIGACKDAFDLDINENPNAPTPDNPDLNAVYNNTHLNFLRFNQDIWAFSSGVTRMRAMTNRTYEQWMAPEFFNTMWNRAYADLLPDLFLVEDIASAQDGFRFHEGTSKILRAHLMTTLVDIFGDVPFDRPISGTSDDINPDIRSGQAIYAEALGLLDEAIALLADVDPARPQVDFFYNGNAANWIRLANTLKFRIFFNTRLVDSEAGAKMQAILNDGNIITSAAHDWQFNYGTERTNPNTRHFLYNNHYESADGHFMNNYYMWLLLEEKGFTDPRTRFYFYRQNAGTMTVEDNAWGCVLTNNPFESIPPGILDHFYEVDENMPYCIAAENGYWGRDHGNGSGLPPDGDLRTRYGLYPMGGLWDDNSFSRTQTDGTRGALGEGIFPLMLSSYVYFMRAEAALTAGTGENAAEMLELGIRHSMAKVFGFQSRIDASILNRQIGMDPVTGDPVFASSLLPASDVVDNYVASVMNSFGNTSNQLDVIAKEYYIALWGNSLEAYNLQRRTGLPSNLQPLLDIAAWQGSQYPRSSLYPLSFVQRNIKANQKSLTDQVFWDNNPPGFIR